MTIRGDQYGIQRAEALAAGLAASTAAARISLGSSLSHGFSLGGLLLLIGP